MPLPPRPAHPTSADRPSQPGYSVENPAVGIQHQTATSPHPGAEIMDQALSGNPHELDPSRQIEGMPPNWGESLLPHVTTFQGIISSVSRVYRPSDEAIKHSFDNAKFMRNDLVVMECIEQRQRSVSLLNWHLEPEDEKDPAQIEMCTKLKKVIEEIPRFMQYRENLLNATWYGKYAVQHRFRWKRVAGKMRVVCDQWLPVNGDKLVFRYDDGTREYNPDQVGVRVGAGFVTGDTVAKRWTVERINKVETTDFGLAYFLENWERPLLAIHKHYIEDGEYEDPANAGRIHGLGIRSRIYWTWFQKQEALAFLMEYMERSAFGIEIWYYPWGNPEAEAKTRTAAQERIGAGRNIILVPKPLGDDADAYGIEKIEPGMAGAAELKDIIINYFGHLIKRYILGQVLTTEAEATGIGSGLGDIHLNTYMQIVRYDATLLEETITDELVKHLKNWNFPEFANVKVKFRIDTESEDAQMKLEAYRNAFEMGLKIKAQDIMDLIGASKPDDDDEILSMEQMQPKHPEEQMGAAYQAGTPIGDDGANAANEVWQNFQKIQQREQILAGLNGQNGNGHSEYDADKGKPGEVGGNENGKDHRAALVRAMAVEMEKTKNPQLAIQLAMDRLEENPGYYDRLMGAQPEQYNNQANGLEFGAYDRNTSLRAMNADDPVRAPVNPSENSDRRKILYAANAVAVCQQGDKWLLGKAQNSGDDREGKFCFPGGGIKRSESDSEAAARECFEETGIKCSPSDTPMEEPDGKTVFFACDATGGELKPNREFSEVGFYTLDEMKNLDLHGNVRPMITAAEHLKKKYGSDEFSPEFPDGQGPIAAAKSPQQLRTAPNFDYGDGNEVPTMAGLTVDPEPFSAESNNITSMVLAEIARRN